MNFEQNATVRVTQQLHRGAAPGTHPISARRSTARRGEQPPLPRRLQAAARRSRRVSLNRALGAIFKEPCQGARGSRCLLLAEVAALPGGLQPHTRLGLWKGHLHTVEGGHEITRP